MSLHQSILRQSIWHHSVLHRQSCVSQPCISQSCVGQSCVGQSCISQHINPFQSKISAMHLSLCRTAARDPLAALIWSREEVEVDERQRRRKTSKSCETPPPPGTLWSLEQIPDTKIGKQSQLKVPPQRLGSKPRKKARIDIRPSCPKPSLSIVPTLRLSLVCRSLSFVSIRRSDGPAGSSQDVLAAFLAAGPSICYSIPCCFLSCSKFSLRASRSSFDLAILSGWW
jgi:hypothetical protein